MLSLFHTGPSVQLGRWDPQGPPCRVEAVLLWQEQPGPKLQEPGPLCHHKISLTCKFNKTSFFGTVFSFRGFKGFSIMNFWNINFENCVALQKLLAKIFLWAFVDAIAPYEGKEYVFIFVFSLLKSLFQCPGSVLLILEVMYCNFSMLKECDVDWCSNNLMF